MARHHDSIRIGQAAVGLGVFARQRLNRGQVVGEIRGTIIDDPDYGSDYCIDLRDGKRLEPASPFCYVNHSCEPNCELFCYETDYDDAPLADRIWLQTRRTIRPGEQLTIDYAWSAADAIPCRCGSERCRGWVVSLDELPQLLEKVRVAPLDGL